MSKVIALVTNDLNQDQRMHRICTSMLTIYDDVTLVGRIKPSSSKLIDQEFNQERLTILVDHGPLFYLFMNISLLFYLIKNRPNIVYAVDLDTMLAASLYKIFSGNKLIFDAHEYFTEVPELTHSKLKQSIWNMLGNLSIPKADVFITVNDSLAEIFSKKYNREFKVIRNVPSMIDRPIVNFSKNKIVLYQGVLNKGRGLEMAIKVISDMPDYILWILGEGDLSTSLRTFSEKYNKYDNIVFKGWETPEQLVITTSESWVGINLLDSDSDNYKFSLANKFFDYMHAGIPSINMNFPEYRKINDKHNVAVLIDNLDYSDIQKAIVDLSDDRLYRKLSNNSIIAKKSFNWNLERKKLEHILANI